MRLGQLSPCFSFYKIIRQNKLNIIITVIILRDISIISRLRCFTIVSKISGKITAGGIDISNQHCLGGGEGGGVGVLDQNEGAQYLNQINICKDLSCAKYFGHISVISSRIRVVSKANVKTN